MLGRDDILRAFSRLSDELQSRGARGEVVLVGGAALVLLLGVRKCDS
jgi:hypothetical protein